MQLHCLARQQTEVTEMKWVRMEKGGENRPARWIINELKDPKKKALNTVRAVVPVPALEIAKAMQKPRSGPFPLKVDSISARFNEPFKLNGIVDLSFDDLRHESHTFLTRGKACRKWQQLTVTRLGRLYKGIQILITFLTNMISRFGLKG